MITPAPIHKNYYSTVINALTEFAERNPNEQGLLALEAIDFYTDKSPTTIPASRQPVHAFGFAKPEKYDEIKGFSPLVGTFVAMATLPSGDIFACTTYRIYKLIGDTFVPCKISDIK